jgi:predicted dithiol-disulfide oxidoreductase (DUF899 family)
MTRLDGFVVHLAHHDVMLWAASRAPLAKLQAYKQRMGWMFPWASSLGSDFNFDFNVSVTEEQPRAGAVEYNYRRATPRPVCQGTLAGDTRRRCQAHGHDRHRRGHLRAREARHERVRARGRRRLPHLFHLRARTGRPIGRIQWLDRAPKVRNETGYWRHLHDEYDKR